MSLDAMKDIAFFNQCSVVRLEKPFVWCGLLKYKSYHVWLSLDTWHTNCAVWPVCFIVSRELQVRWVHQ